MTDRARAHSAEELESQLRVAEAHCDLLRRDAARLNYLDSRVWTVERSGSGYLFLRVGDTFCGGQTIRDAIDVAMAAEGIIT